MKLCLLLSLFSMIAAAQQRPARGAGDPLSALRARALGPALTSGRVTSFAVNPKDPSTYFVGVASGGVWRTTNRGVTFQPVFENEGSYSIGHVAIDPHRPNTIWVGTGENNSQRSVGYGDGVYRSDDNGKSWRNMGLKSSEHIGKIVIDKNDPNTIFVAAQGPLWGPGGDRGLYKSTDAGKTWNRTLHSSDNTGATDVAQSPHHPDILLAATWQRRRHVYTLINGGPESALYISRDRGATWNKVRGLPADDLGRIGIAFSPARECLAYARVEAASTSTIYRSTDCGASWEARSPFASQGMYYGQIIADPVDPERFILADMIAKISEDGGRTLRPLGDRSKHIDTHTFWFDPRDNRHLLTGCDGGVYESFDRGDTWLFKANIPTMQFYDVTVDNSAPNYFIYGGTQDNWSLGGPSRTRSASGILNSDWFVTNGGDGFQSRVDPTDPNIVYAESQYGGLIRFDRRTGERVGIQPQEGKGEPALRWNWDSPLLISPHAPSRIYFAANKLFRSDDRGASWRAVSPDLSRQLNRDSLPVMDRLWPFGSVAKHQSTSQYGNISALSESPKKEGLLFAGTDDGLIQISENGGAAWKKIDSFPGVPERSFVTRILASQHDPSTVYALFNNHKSADFKPYVYVSKDRGATWKSITADLPANGPVWAIAEDHVDPNLLFIGTEFGLFFSSNSGEKWTRLRAGLPTIAIRDIAIQKRENDLVLATFGRGIYVIDDYSPIRLLTPAALQQEGILLPVKSTSLYIESQPLGGRGRSWQGEGFFTADNPPFGAIFTYHLKDAYQSSRQIRQDAERTAIREKKELVFPTLDQLMKEEEEDSAAILLTVTDAAGKVVRRLSGPATKGSHRIAWNLRLPPPSVPTPRPDGEPDGFRGAPSGPLVAPGVYKVTLAKRVNGAITPLGAAQSFTVNGPASLKPLSDFLQNVSKLQRAATGAGEVLTSARAKLAAIDRSLNESTADPKLRQESRRIDLRLKQLQDAITGSRLPRQLETVAPPSILERANNIAGNYRSSTTAPHAADLDSYKIAHSELAAHLPTLRTLIETDLPKLERELEAAGVPHTPGRIPELK